MSEESVEGFIAAEEVSGIVQCYNPECDYWGEMTGYINPDNTKIIAFLCPECNYIERVANPLI